MGEPFSGDCLPCASCVKRKTPSQTSSGPGVQHSGRLLRRKCGPGLQECFSMLNTETSSYHQPPKGHGLGQGMPSEPGGLVGALTMI